MKWTEHGERVIYDSPWVSLHLADVEVLEETGWQPGPLRHLYGCHPTNGISDMRFEIFAADGATYVDEPSDPSESSKVEWVPFDRVRELVRSGGVQDGLSLTALLWWLLHEAV